MLYEVRKIGNPAQRIMDIGAVIRLSFADVAVEFELTPENCKNHPSFLTDSALLEPHSRPGVRCFGAFAGSALVGFAAIWPKGPGAYELTRLCVVPEHRHAGLGAGLVQAALQAAKAQGASKIEIGIIAENERLKRWYEGLGFQEKAVRKFAHLPFAVCEMEREVGK